MFHLFFLQLPIADKDKLIAADSVAKAKLSGTLQELSSMSVQDVIKTIATGAIEVIFKILIALAIYFIGRWLIKRLLKGLREIFDRRHIELSLRTFLLSLIRITLYIFLVLITVNVLGINTTSLIAIFASAGLAIGMALSGTLQNFAGGVMVLLLKPYQVGDYIEAQGQQGTVKEIQLFHTILNTVDNKRIIIPNGGISTGIVNNYSKEATRRVDWTFSIAYGDDYDAAKALLSDLLDKDDRVLKDPAYLVALNQLADSSVNIVVRAWTPTAEYWNLFFDMNEKVYKLFPQHGLHIPFPQLDVHLPKSE